MENHSAEVPSHHNEHCIKGHKSTTKPVSPSLTVYLTTCASFASFPRLHCHVLAFPEECCLVHEGKIARFLAPAFRNERPFLTWHAQHHHLNKFTVVRLPSLVVKIFYKSPAFPSSDPSSSMHKHLSSQLSLESIAYTFDSWYFGSFGLSCCLFTSSCACRLLGSCTIFVRRCKTPAAAHFPATRSI